jgi:hypothetical protein
MKIRKKKEKEKKGGKKKEKKKKPHLHYTNPTFPIKRAIIIF